MMDEGYEVLFGYSVGDIGLITGFDTKEKARSAAEEHMRDCGLTGKYFIEGLVDGKVYPKYGEEHDLVI